MKVKLTICDDDGNVLPNAPSIVHSLEMGGQTLDEIEQAVEEFRHQALPELEVGLLKTAQDKLTQELKKQDLSP